MLCNMQYDWLKSQFALLALRAIVGVKKAFYTNSYTRAALQPVTHPFLQNNCCGDLFR